MEKELLTKEQTETLNIKSLLEASGFSNLTVSEVRYFGSLCKELNLNPFKKEIYAVPFNKNGGARTIQPIVSYETYLSKAYSTPRFYRYEKSFSGEGINLKMSIKVFDINNNVMWDSTCDIKEFAKMDYNKTKLMGMWAQIPKLMLEKCVVVRACRFVCPNLVGDLPYTMEEMLQAKGFNEKPKEIQGFTDKNIECKVSVKDINKKLEGLKNEK